MPHHTKIYVGTTYDVQLERCNGMIMVSTKTFQIGKCNVLVIKISGAW